MTNQKTILLSEKEIERIRKEAKKDVIETFRKYVGDGVNIDEREIELVKQKHLK